MDHSILQRRKFYKSCVFSIDQVQMELPDHSRAEYDMLIHPGSVTIVPLDAEGCIHFVRQYRLGSESELLELPAGTLEKGEDPQECALRELREETGMAAGSLQSLGDLYLCPGYSTEHMHMYLATDLSSAPLAGDKDEFLTRERIPLQKVEKMIASNEINDGKSLAGLMLAWAPIQKKISKK